MFINAISMNTKSSAPSLKPILLAAAVLAGLSAAPAQEQLSRSEALKYAFAVSANLGEMLQTPIPTDPDVKRPVAVREGEYGAMVLPEAKLNLAALAKAGKEGTPVAQLWLLKLVPMNDGQPVPTDKLRLVNVSTDEGSAQVPCCALGVRAQSGGEGLELLVYGQDKKPVLTAPLKPISRTQDNVVDLVAERKDDGGLLTLRILGKYEATFMVTDPDQF
jgi:hypothetical protein